MANRLNPSISDYGHSKTTSILCYFVDGSSLKCQVFKIVSFNKKRDKKGNLRTSNGHHFLSDAN